MLGFLIKKVIGSKNDREVKRLWPLVRRINEEEEKLQQVSEEALRDKTRAWKEELSQIQDLEQQITKFDYKKLESLGKQQAKSKSDAEDSESKIKALQSELALKTLQKQKLVSDLESALERLGTKYQIILD